MYVTPDRAARTFWWERARPMVADLSPLRAVVFDVDALPGADGAPRDGLADLVLSLFVAGVWIGVVGSGRREDVVPLVRDLIGDGLTETIVSSDDLAGGGSGSDLYRLVLWELGIAPENVLAITGSNSSFCAAAGAGLPATVIGDRDRSGYDGLLVDDCRLLQTQWLVRRLSCPAASG